MNISKSNSLFAVSRAARTGVYIVIDVSEIPTASIFRIEMVAIRDW